jgi:predicted alpha/beta-fold hydrolase
LPRVSGFEKRLGLNGKGQDFVIIKRSAAITMIAKTILLAVSALVAAWSPNSARGAERVEAIPTRPGVTMKFIVRNETTGNPPIVILFAGGDGILKLDSWNGKGNPSGNFLVRTRKHFARNKLLAVVPDAPSDLQTDGLSMLRTSKDHAADIAAVIKHLRKYSKGPVFLVGTSRGTISAAGVTANLPVGTVAGVVLTASVTRYNRGNDKHRVHNAKLENIHVPVLFAHHEDDTCYVTLFSDIPDLAKRFVNAPSVKIKGYTGGGNYRGDECAAHTAHGFRGIEKRVVKDIADWIKKVTPGAKP